MWVGWVVRRVTRAGGACGMGGGGTGGGLCCGRVGCGTVGEAEREGEKEGDGQWELSPSVGDWEGEVGLPEGDAEWGGLS